MDYSGISAVPNCILTNVPRPELSLHPCPRGQKIRTPIQGRRRACVPLHPPVQHLQSPNPRRRRRAPRPVAPESARICSAVRYEFFTAPNSLLTKPTNRYASDLTPDQKDALLDVVRATPHAQIGPEIRRELVNSVVRGAPRTDGDIEMT
jgi:hypothetical protein